MCINLQMAYKKVENSFHKYLKTNESTFFEKYLIEVDSFRIQQAL